MAGRSAIFGVVGLVAGVTLGVSIHRLPRRPEAVKPVPLATAQAPRQLPERKVATPEPIAETPTQVVSMPALTRLRELCGKTRNCDVGECLLLIKQLTAAECREAVALFRGLPHAESVLLTQALARRWASLDSEGVLEAAVRMNDRDLAQLFALEGARALVSRDAEAALEKLTSRDLVQCCWAGQSLPHSRSRTRRERLRF